MSWLPLIAAYLLVMIALTWRMRGHFSGRWAALLRTLLAGSLLLMLGEVIAEERGLWAVPRPLGLFLFKAPAEGFLLVVATLLNSLLPYVALRQRAKRPSPRPDSGSS